ncbi:thimet oligopeptidase [Talaromyces pinophilus]|uniref:Thimet oligopeptidase n=1 Tax=Talaromyces pinophilus TaxID=128442 RepID=A0A0B8MXI7_TALPI|nr:thimet oligopeptidase [Talaromyces pinophilus]
MSDSLCNAASNLFIEKISIAPPLLSDLTPVIGSVFGLSKGFASGTVNDMELPRTPANSSASPTGLLVETERLIEGARSIYAQLVNSISPEKAAFTNTIVLIAQIENKLIAAKKLFGFYNSIPTSSELHEASRKTSVLFGKFESETLTRDDLFRLVDNVIRNQEQGNPPKMRLLAKQTPVLSEKRIEHSKCRAKSSIHPSASSSS